MKHKLTITLTVESVKSAMVLQLAVTAMIEHLLVRGFNMHNTECVARATQLAAAVTQAQASVTSADIK